MHNALIYLLYWIATAIGLAFCGAVVILEALVTLALLGTARRAAETPETAPVREEPPKPT